MKTAGEVLSSERIKKKISIGRAARDLKIKKEHLAAIERGDWAKLPEPPFTKGFIKSYATYLGLDWQHLLALFRREFDETKFSQKSPTKGKKFILQPNYIPTLLFGGIIIAFIAYLAVQYLSILSAPKLEIFLPVEDTSTTVPFIVVSGQTEKETTVAVNGQFISVDQNGNFSYQLKLNQGQNNIEIIASKRLSPKSKVERVVRLSR